MSSLFHALKKTAKGGDAREDVEFNDARTRFELFAATVVKLKGNVASFLAHFNSALLASTQVAQDFTTLLCDPEGPETAENELTSTVRSSQTAHSTLSNDVIPKNVQYFQSQVLAALDSEIQYHIEIAKRITQRQALWEEQGYYAKKVHQLREEREQRVAKGKSDSAADIEKLERNNNKYAEVLSSYNALNIQLMADMKSTIEGQRISGLGPIMRRFLQQEKTVVDQYSEALQHIPQ